MAISWMNESIYLHAENDPPIRPSRLCYSATCGSYKSRAGGLVDQCDFGSERMRVSVSALVVLLALTVSDGYPTLNSIKDEVQRLMLLKPPTTTAATTSTAATEPPPAKGKKLLALMVAGFVGQLRLPDPPPHTKTSA